MLVHSASFFARQPETVTTLPLGSHIPPPPLPLNSSPLLISKQHGARGDSCMKVTDSCMHEHDGHSPYRMTSQELQHKKQSKLDALLHLFNRLDTFVIGPNSRWPKNTVLLLHAGS